jgi:hypothetical protein
VQAFEYAGQGGSEGLLHQSCHSSRSLESYAASYCDRTLYRGPQAQTTSLQGTGVS